MNCFVWVFLFILKMYVDEQQRLKMKDFIGEQSTFVFCSFCKQASKKHLNIVKCATCVASRSVTKWSSNFKLFFTFMDLRPI